MLLHSEPYFDCFYYYILTWVISVGLLSALVNIVFILALRAAEYRTWPVCHKSLLAVPADADRLFAVRQHEAEHHLYSKHKGVEIPNNRRLIEQGDPVGRGNATKGLHTLLHELPLLRGHFVIVLIVQHGSQIGKGQVGKLLLYPFIALRILTLKTHIDRHRSVRHGHGQCHHHTVILDVPHGFYAALHHIRLVKREE